MPMKLSKDQTITVSWSTISSLVVSLAAVWGFGSAIVQKALAGEIQEQIAKQLAPQTAASIVTLSATVKNLRTSITALEFKKDMCGGRIDGCWTVRDAGDLDAAKIDLKAAEDALKLLKN